MKNILITGINGQLGSEMRLLASQHNDYCYFFTDIAELDICNEKAVRDFVKSNDIDVIVNCAAFTAVDKAEDEPEFCDRLNHLAVGNLARAIESRQGYLIQISTDYVFDGTAHIPYTEYRSTCPASVYGAMKLKGEEIAMECCSHTMVVRTAWLYSTFGSNFVKTMIRLGCERASLGVVFDQIGTPAYARDLAEAICVAIEKRITPGVYHFTDEGVCFWYDFTKMIHMQAGISGCTVNPLHSSDYPTRALRPHYSVLDKTKIKRTYNIEIPHWMESLKACIDELKAV